MDEVFLKPNYQKNNNLCLADIQRTLKPKQMWEVLQISPSQSHAGAFSVPVKELRLGSQHQIRDSALALWQRGTFHEEPQRELSEACQHRAVSSSWVETWMLTVTTTEPGNDVNPFGFFIFYLQKTVFEVVLLLHSPGWDVELLPCFTRALLSICGVICPKVPVF